MREVKVLAETVDCDEYPVSVAAVVRLDCWIGVARCSTFRRDDEAVWKAGKTGGTTTVISFWWPSVHGSQSSSTASKHGRMVDS
jgi:hypothetical protein